MKYKTIKETVVDINSSFATVTSSEPEIWKQIRSWKRKYGDEIEIKYTPSTNGGYMLAHIPVRYAKNMRYVK